MNELINVKNENGQLLVSARDLHEFLEIKTKFTDWFPRMCEYGFEENIDYVPCSKTSVANQYGGSKEIQDYACNISMAKEIAMIQRSDKGKQARKYFIECENQLKTVAIQSPKAFVDSLSLTEHSISKYLPNFLSWKNVDEVMPLLIERVTASVDTGDVKLGVLSTTINVAKAVRDSYPNTAEKEIMTRYIEQAQAKYDRVLIASKAGITKANNDLKTRIEEKNKELRKAETKRLKDFSRKSLINAYEDSKIIQDLVDDIVRNVLTCDEKDAFKANLKANVKLIVDNSNLTWEEAYTAVYNAMGLFTKPTTYKTMVDYIWDYELDKKCLDAAVRVRARFGC